MGLPNHPPLLTMICRRGGLYTVDHGQGVLHAKISLYCQLGNGKLAQIFIHACSSAETLGIPALGNLTAEITLIFKIITPLN